MLHAACGGGTSAIRARRPKQLSSAQGVLGDTRVPRCYIRAVTGGGGSSPSPIPKSPYILLADVQRASRHTLQAHLEEAGYRVRTTGNGEGIIVLCDIDPPDVLIMDVHLPDMDGFEVCEYVRHETRDADLTVILLSEPTDDMIRAYLGQMVDYARGDYFFAKPCDGKLLVQLLDTLFEETDNANGQDTAFPFPTRAVWPTTRLHYLVSTG